VTEYNRLLASIQSLPDADEEEENDPYAGLLAEIDSFDPVDPAPSAIPTQAAQAESTFAPQPQPARPAPDPAKVRTRTERGMRSLDLDLRSYDALVGWDDVTSKVAGMFGDDDKPRKMQELISEQVALEQERRLNPAEGDDPLTEAALAAAEMAGPMAQGTAQGLATGAAVGAVSLAIPGPDELITFPVANMLGSAQMWYRQGAGSMGRDMIRQGVDPTVASIVAQGAAVPYAALEFMQVRRILGPLGDKIMREAAQKVARTVPRVLARAGVGMVTDVAKETTEEMMQEAVQIAAKESARIYSNEFEGTAVEGSLKDALFPVDPETGEREFSLLKVAEEAGPALAVLMMPGRAVRTATEVGTRRARDQRAVELREGRKEVREALDTLEGELEEMSPEQQQAVEQVLPDHVKQALSRRRGRTTTDGDELDDILNDPDVQAAAREVSNEQQSVEEVVEEQVVEAEDESPSPVGEPERTATLDRLAQVLPPNEVALMERDQQEEIADVLRLYDESNVDYFDAAQELFNKRGMRHNPITGDFTPLQETEEETEESQARTDEDNKRFNYLVKQQFGEEPRRPTVDVDLRKKDDAGKPGKAVRTGDALVLDGREAEVVRNYKDETLVRFLDDQSEEWTKLSGRDIDAQPKADPTPTAPETQTGTPVDLYDRERAEISVGDALTIGDRDAEVIEVESDRMKVRFADDDSEQWELLNIPTGRGISTGSTNQTGPTGTSTDDSDGPGGTTTPHTQFITGDTRGKGGKRPDNVRDAGWGRLWTPNEGRTPTPEADEPWAMDNGAFDAESAKTGKPGKKIDLDKWEKWVRRGVKVGEKRNNKPFMVVLPDVMNGGEESFAFTTQALERVGDLDVPFYIAAQPGMDLQDDTKWHELLLDDRVDGIFLGGDEAFKEKWGPLLASQAHEVGKKLHYARAGTKRKLLEAMRMRADSADSAFPLWTKERQENLLDSRTPKELIDSLSPAEFERLREWDENTGDTAGFVPGHNFETGADYEQSKDEARRFKLDQSLENKGLLEADGDDWQHLKLVPSIAEADAGTVVARENADAEEGDLSSLAEPGAPRREVGIPQSEGTFRHANKNRTKLEVKFPGETPAASRNLLELKGWKYSEKKGVWTAPNTQENEHLLSRMGIKDPDFEEYMGRTGLQSGGVGARMANDVWTVSRDEFVEQVRAGRDFETETPLEALRESGDFETLDAQAKAYHEEQVRQEFADGRMIFQGILRDYPDLFDTPQGQAGTLSWGDKLDADVTKLSDDKLEAVRIALDRVEDEPGAPRVREVERIAEVEAEQERRAGQKAQQEGKDSEIGQYVDITGVGKERLESQDEQGLDEAGWPPVEPHTGKTLTVLSLFDHSGEWASPYAEAGHNVFTVDMKEGPNVSWVTDINDFTAAKLMEFLEDFSPSGDVDVVLAACPCTHFTVSGAQYWKAKDADGRTQEAVELVHQTLRAIGFLKPDVWALENPVGRLNKLVPELADYGPTYVQPFWFGNEYSKKTGLWGRFNKDLPRNEVEPGESPIMKLGGKSEKTKELRSITPRGFARAFYEANKSEMIPERSDDWWDEYDGYGAPEDLNDERVGWRLGPPDADWGTPEPYALPKAEPEPAPPPPKQEATPAAAPVPASTSSQELVDAKDGLRYYVGIGETGAMFTLRAKGIEPGNRSDIFVKNLGNTAEAAREAINRWEQESGVRVSGATDDDLRTIGRISTEVFPIGKHAGKTIAQVLEEFPDYAQWAAGNLSPSRKISHDFIAALRAAVDAKFPPPDVAVVEATDEDREILHNADLTVSQDDDAWVVDGKTFPHRRTLGEVAGELQGSFDRRSKTWRYRYDPTAAIAEQLKESGLAATAPGQFESRGDERPEPVRSDAEPEGRIRVGRWEFTADADVSGIPAGLRESLTDHQQQGVAKAVAAMDSDPGGFLLADGTGVGKTRQILAVSRIYADRGQPVLIVAPNEVLGKPFSNKGKITGSYAKDAEAMGLDIELVKDKTAFEPGKVYVTTYTRMGRLAASVDENTVLVWDEAHGLKNLLSGTSRAEVGNRMSEKARSVLYATATPADKPVHLPYMARVGVLEGKDMEDQMEFLGLEKRNINGREFWAVKDEVGETLALTRMGWLFDRMTAQGRMVKREISFQGVDVQMETVDLPPQWKDVEASIYTGFGHPDSLQGLQKARVLMHLRRQQEPYKIQRIADSVEEELAAGRRPIIFVSRVNYSEAGQDIKVQNAISGEWEVVGREVYAESEGTAKALREELANRGITDLAELHGGAETKAADAMEKFQSGKARVVLATIESGGTGINLDDTVGDAPRTMIVATAPFDAVGNVQAAGRGWRLTTKSDFKIRYLFANTEVDQWNRDIIAAKMRHLGATVRGQVERLNVTNEQGEEVELDVAPETDVDVVQAPKRKTNPNKGQIPISLTVGSIVGKRAGTLPAWEVQRVLDATGTLEKGAMQRLLRASSISDRDQRQILKGTKRVQDAIVPGAPGTDVETIIDNAMQTPEYAEVLRAAGVEDFQSFADVVRKDGLSQRYPTRPSDSPAMAEQEQMASQYDPDRIVQDISETKDIDSLKAMERWIWENSERFGDRLNQILDTVKRRGDFFGDITPFQRKSDADASELPQRVPGNDVRGTSAADARHMEEQAVARLESAVREANQRDGFPDFPSGSLQRVDQPGHRSAEAAAKIAKVFGKNLVWIKATNPSAGSFNGVTFEGSVFLNVDTDNHHVAVVGHELTHLLADDQPDLFDKLVTTLKEDGATRRWLRHKGGRQFGDNTSLAVEELAADVVGARMTEREFWVNLQEQAPDVVRQVYNYLKQLLTKIRLAFNQSYNQDAYLKDVEAVRNSVAQVMGEWAHREYVAGLSKDDPRYQLMVKHASPHKFSNFALSQVGTGEGAQAFGWGGYFTDTDGVFHSYLEQFKRRNHEQPGIKAHGGIIRFPTPGHTTWWSGVGAQDTVSDLDALLDYARNAFHPDGGRSMFDYMMGHLAEVIPARLSHAADGAAKDDMQRLADFWEETLKDADLEDFVIPEKPGAYGYKVALHKGKDPSEYDYVDWYEELTNEQADKILRQGGEEGLFLDEEEIRQGSFSFIYRNVLEVNLQYHAAEKLDPPPGWKVEFKTAGEMKDEARSGFEIDKVPDKELWRVRHPSIIKYMGGGVLYDSKQEALDAIEGTLDAGFYTDTWYATPPLETADVEEGYTRGEVITGAWDTYDNEEAPEIYLYEANGEPIPLDHSYADEQAKEMLPEVKEELRDEFIGEDGEVDEDALEERAEEVAQSRAYDDAIENQEYEWTAFNEMTEEEYRIVGNQFQGYRVSTNGEVIADYVDNWDDARLAALEHNEKMWEEDRAFSPIKPIRSDRAASLFLLRAGIDGIRYPTSSLSAAGPGDGHNYVVFDENAISIEEVARFQKKRGAEGGPPLIAVHGTTAEGIRNQVELGGLPVPSLAITTPDKVKDALRYGDITLIGTKDLVDPEISTNKTYPADAYTRRQPRREYHLQDDEMEKLASRMAKTGLWRADWDAHNDLEQMNLDRGLENAIYEATEGYGDSHRRLRLWFLKEQGVEIETPTKPRKPRSRIPGVSPKSKVIRDFIAAKGRKIPSGIEFGGDDHRELSEVALALLDESLTGEVSELRADFREDLFSADTDLLGFNAVDKFAEDLRAIASREREPNNDLFDKRIDRAVKKAGGNEAVEKWVRETFGVVQGGEFFTTDAGRKQPYRLQEILAEMTRRGTSGQEGGLVYGLGQSRAAAAKPFTSVEQMRSEAGGIVTKDEVDAATKELQESEFFPLVDRLREHYEWADPGAMSFDRFDDASKAMGDYLKNGPKGVRGAMRALSKNGYRGVPERLVSDFLEVAEKLERTPTAYFEAKPQRAVDLSEWAGAVVPRGTDEDVLDILKQNGVKRILTYKPGDQDDRAKKVQKFRAPRFQRKATWTGEKAVRPSSDLTMDQWLAEIETQDARRQQAIRDVIGPNGGAVEIGKNRYVISKNPMPNRTEKPWRVTQFFNRPDVGWEPWGHRDVKELDQPEVKNRLYPEGAIQEIVSQSSPEDAIKPVRFQRKKRYNPAFDPDQTGFSFGDQRQLPTGARASDGKGLEGTGLFEAAGASARAKAQNDLFAPAEAAGAPPSREEQAKKEWQEKGTDSRWFRRWAGKDATIYTRDDVAQGKAAFETGKPVAVEAFHGTSERKPIDAFSAEKLGESTGTASAKKGHFFTSVPDVAENFGRLSKTKAWGRNEADSDERGVSILPVYLAFRNPLVLDGEGYEFSMIDAVTQAESGGHDGLIVENTYDSPSPPKMTLDGKDLPIDHRSEMFLDIEEFQKNPSGRENPLKMLTDVVNGYQEEVDYYRREIRTWESLSEEEQNALPAHRQFEYLEDLLRDAEIEVDTWTEIRDAYADDPNRVRVERQGRSTVYVAFNPTQIKSATGNRGTFDAENPDIRFQRKGLHPLEQRMLEVAGGEYDGSSDAGFILADGTVTARPEDHHTMAAAAMDGRGGEDALTPFMEETGAMRVVQSLGDALEVQAEGTPTPAQIRSIATVARDYRSMGINLEYGGGYHRFNSIGELQRFFRDQTPRFQRGDDVLRELADRLSNQPGAAKISGAQLREKLGEAKVEEIISRMENSSQFREAVPPGHIAEEEDGDVVIHRPLEIPPEKTSQLIRRYVQDKLNRLEQVEDIIGDVEEDAKTYREATLFIGRASEQIEQFDKWLEEDFLKRAVEADLSIDDMGWLLYAGHAKERNAHIATKNPDFEDGGSGMTDEEADEILARYGDNLAAQSLADEFLDRVTRETLRLRFEAGFLTQEAYDGLRGQFERYVPLKGKAGTENHPVTGKGFSVPSRGIRSAYGRRSVADNPFTQAIADHTEAIIAAEKNKVGQHFLNLVELHPSESWEAQVQTFLPRYDQDGNLLFMDPKVRDADNVLSTWVDGKKHVITIHDPALASGMKNLGMERGIKWLNGVNSFLRGMATIWNPEFILTNLERDLQTAGIHLAGERSGAIAAKVVGRVLKGGAYKGIWRNIRDGRSNEWSEWYQEFKDMGGKTGWYDVASLDEKAEDLQKRMGRMAKPNLLNAGRAVVDYIADVNEMVESGIRLATYRTLVEEGVSKKDAAAAAKELTVNFNKKGELGQLLNSLWLFSNAGIQGSFRIFHALLKYPKVRGIAAGLVGLSFLQSIANRLIDPEDWDDTDDWTKDNYFLVPTGEGKFVSWKLPWGYNVFHVLGNVLADSVIGDLAGGAVDRQWTPQNVTLPELAGRVLSSFDDAFNPLGGGSFNQFLAPSAVDPFVQWWENKDFAGRPLRKEVVYGNDKSNQQLAFSSVREPSKEFTRWLYRMTGGEVGETWDGKEVYINAPYTVDINPEMVDHFLDQFGSGLGKFIGNSIATGRTLSKGDVPEINSVPMLRQMLKAPREWTPAKTAREIVKRSGNTLIGDDQLTRFNAALGRAVARGAMDEEEATKLRSQIENAQGKLRAAIAPDGFDPEMSMEDRRLLLARFRGQAQGYRRMGHTEKADELDAKANALLEEFGGMRGLLQSLPAKDRKLVTSGTSRWRSKTIKELRKRLDAADSPYQRLVKVSSM